MQTNVQPPHDRWVPPKEAAAMNSVSLATLWRWAQLRSDFPKPVRLSAKCTRWSLAALLAWREAQK